MSRPTAPSRSPTLADMTDQRFTSRVEAVQWGRSRYTVIRVPEELVAAARDAGTRRVAGTIDGTPVNAALTRAPVVNGPFLWAGASLLHRLRVEPGEPVDCALAPVDGDIVDLPEDVRLALDEADALGRWEALTPATRRRRLHAVESAKRPETRARRIAELLNGPPS